MSNLPVRTRFAPSPTGYLHVGGARTALFSWLYARHFNGQFVLRIEDTDQERSTPESIQAILDAMQWLKLDYDEGPFYQSKRFDRYREILQQLLQSGHAYRCYCSKERLDKLRTEQQANKQKPRYDGLCRDLNLTDDTKPFVVRFRTPQSGNVSFTDLIRGEISVKNSELDDLILARSDGVPTYNFTVVVDDWDMKISHVIRGDDHVNNTPRQIHILQALNADIPQYAHVPMILGSDGKRLSKRHGAMSVMEYYEQGYLSQALLNYLARLGWAHGDQEIFSTNELVQLFGLEAISRSPAAFNTEKLTWLNQHYLKATPAVELVELLKSQFKKLNINTDAGPALTDVINLQAERSKTLQDMAQQSRYFYEPVKTYEEKAARKFLKSDIVPVLTAIRAQMQALATWEKEPLHQIIIAVAEQSQLKLGKVAQPIRVALTGGTISPPIDATLALLGRKTVLERLDQALEFIATH
ncbi:MAG: glutamate--tRNA ligase [Gammaproteobacteria bacterium]|nr:glutamate--tRNA ligase [Gammaproteobacteria bacterium]